MSIKTFLLLLSGAAWTIVYIDCIRIGFRDKTYAMPFWALALNITWEILHAFSDVKVLGFDTQVVINIVWATFDLFILYTFFRFGKKYFPKNIRPAWFYAWGIGVLLISMILQWVFTRQYGLILGGGYAAFLQNLLMSVLYIVMLVHRNGPEGQSLTIAVSKWIGTLAPTILFGIMGTKTTGGPNFLMLVTGLMISVLDLLYIYMLIRAQKPDKTGLREESLF